MRFLFIYLFYFFLEPWRQSAMISPFDIKKKINEMIKGKKD